MASTIEIGHAKNVATFEDLISFLTGYGATYNPTKAALKLPALATQLTAASATLQTVKVAKTANDNATNARELAFKPLKPLATKIMNALAATDAETQTLDDAKSTNMKIQGKRAKAVAQPDAKALAAGATPVKTASTSQQSFDKMIDHFAQLIATLTAEANYSPNEIELQVTKLNTILADLKTKNTDVINTTTVLSNARIDRDNALYGADTGLVDVAQDAKQYVKSLFGATSPQYKQVSGLKFTRGNGE
ncbi:MAG: hypothetical protein KA713_09855 [Chryseotalea sp. WA131a]|jgi:hypothetical protein|nr:MAG: hypothetical protein KA713_09855 [Chryseotalea sp. WA131a]